MTESEASALLSARLGTLAGLPPVAWMNSPTFTPPVGDTWLAEFDMSAGTADPTVNLAGYQDKDGIYQVNVMTVVGGYRFTGIQLAEQIKALYRGYRESGLTIMSVEIDKQSRSTDWWMTPVSVNYRVLF